MSLKKRFLCSQENKNAFTHTHTFTSTFFLLLLSIVLKKWIHIYEKKFICKKINEQGFFPLDGENQ